MTSTSWGVPAVRGLGRRIRASGASQRVLWLGDDLSDTVCYAFTESVFEPDDDDTELVPVLGPNC